MKKIVSLSLAAIMLLSMVPTAFAADYTAGTKVEYTAADQTAYTITVPAQLAPGASGEVKLEGTWASDATVKVTADASVTLTNSINAEDKHTLDITFPGIEKAGDNTQSRTYTENVTVAEMPADALFGTWSGKFNYNVEFDDGLIEIQYQRQTTANTELTTHTIRAKEGMTWREWLNSSYKDPTAILVNFDPYSGTISIGLAYLIDENNKFVSPDAVIDPDAHYELFMKNGSQMHSPSFGATEPTYP